MVNTIYFHNTIRDVFSTTTEETSTSSNSYTTQPGSSSVNPNDDEGGIFEYSSLKQFSFNELQSATRNFRKDHRLGEGSYGNGMVFNGWIFKTERLDYPRRYFKGWIDENKLTATKPGEGIAVAIKQLSKFTLAGHGGWWGSAVGLNSNSPAVLKMAEINYLGRLHHPNLVRLLGYSAHSSELLLVYEFMPERSLADHLFEKVSTLLSWSVRVKIALGAAKGLAFLHSAPINVIHRNFKSSTILLDMDYNANLSGFKLAMNGPTGDRSHVSTEVMGTSGYLAPEYIATGDLTAKCDVYAFGVVLLEMLSGRRVIDMDRPSEEHNLVDWAKPFLNQKNRVNRVADSRLEGQYSLKGFQKAANLAFICLSVKGMSRPNMDEVVKLLGKL